MVEVLVMRKQKIEMWKFSKASFIFLGIAVWLTVGVHAEVLGAVPEENSISPLPPGFCRQFIRVEGGVSAELGLMPLPDGANWAVSTRWDDGSGADIRMADLLEKYGFKGSFYIITGRKPNDFERKLLERGHAVQSHSITHSRLSCISPAEAWKEILVSRIDLESRLDHPVNCFAFPSNSQAGFFNPNAKKSLYRMLLRAGYHHVPVRRDEDAWEISGVNILPADGSPVAKAFQKFYNDPDVQAFEPNISWAYHANTYARKNSWDILEQQLKAHANLSGVWYCRQDEYAAYRMQFNRSRLSEIGPGVYELIRPGMLLTGAEIPLEVYLKGIPGQTPPIVMVDGRRTELIPLPSGGWRFEVLSHDNEGIPTLIGAEDFPYLLGELSVSEDQQEVSFEIENTGEETISDIRITWRLPLPCDSGVEWNYIGDLPPGADWDGKQSLAPKPTTYSQTGGSLLLAVQLDFRLSDGQFGRVYFLTEEMFKTPDSPDNHLMGHVVVEPKNGEEGFQPAKLRHPDGGRCPGPGIALLTELESSGSENVEFLSRGLKEIWLNGKLVNDKYLNLRPGVNSLRLLPARHDFWFSLKPPWIAKFHMPVASCAEQIE